jgi:hypothetical protein
MMMSIISYMQSTLENNRNNLMDDLCRKYIGY